MIKSKSEYKYYLECDKLALNISKNNLIKTYIMNDIWRFERLLRKNEYYYNCRRDILGSLYCFILKYHLHRISIKLGFTIPVNVFGPGLSIAHCGTIVVNGSAKIGANCRIHIDVNIGTEAGKSNEAPIIGDNAYIGPGAKLYGKIILGNNIAIGANSVVNKSYEENDIAIAGVPAKKINCKGSSNLIIRATDIVAIESTHSISTYS